ncbi:MAG TPA: VOC family protein [Acidimicrobiia bacterium]
MSGIPDNLRSVTPSLTVTPCAEAIEFYKDAFGAEETTERMTGPDGVVAHAEIRIGDSVIMLGDEWPDGPTLSPRTLKGSTASLFIYTDDVDSLWKRAIDAGCEVVYPLELQFYGDKGGRVRDPFGHTWGLGQHVEDVSDEEMAKRVEAFYTE